MLRELLEAVLSIPMDDSSPAPENSRDLPMINPCPPGYVLRNIDGNFQCVQEDLQMAPVGALRALMIPKARHMTSRGAPGASGRVPTGPSGAP
jgi:hypothetical protein